MAERPEYLSGRFLLPFSVSLVLGVLVAALAGCVSVEESTQQTQSPPEFTDTPSTAAGGLMSLADPIFFGTEVGSPAEAQSRVGFEIGVPTIVPGNFKLIWMGTSPASVTDSLDQFVRLVYSDGEHHVIVGQQPIEDLNLSIITDEWLAQWRQQRVTIHGHPGIGHERTEREMSIAVVEGKTVKVPVQEPAALRWWPPGLVRSIWTPDDMSLTLADLIVMAESMEPVK